MKIIIICIKDSRQTVQSVMYINKSVLYLYIISSMLRLRCGFCRIEVYTVWDGIRNYEMLLVESGTVIVFNREEISQIFLCVLCVYGFILSFNFLQSTVSIYKSAEVRYSLKGLTVLFYFATIDDLCCRSYVLIETFWNCLQCKILLLSMRCLHGGEE